MFDTFSGMGVGGGWVVGKSDSKENPKSDLDLDLGFVNIKFNFNFKNNSILKEGNVCKCRV